MGSWLSESSWHLQAHELASPDPSPPWSSFPCFLDFFACFFGKEFLAFLSVLFFLWNFSRKTPEGWNCQFQKTAPTEGWVKVQGSVDPRFAADLPFPCPISYNLKHVAIRGKDFSWGALKRSRKQPQPSRLLWLKYASCTLHRGQSYFKQSLQHQC